MKKITLKTKITLTIAGLLTVTGILYAANQQPFGSVNEAVGVASSKTDLLVTEYCNQNINKIDCFGNVSFLAAIPGPGPCAEKYIAIAPSMSANAFFTPRDIFVTQGTNVYKIHESTVTPFATIPGCTDDHTGITFDHFGAFGYNMIVTCQNGGVWQVDKTGTPLKIADLSTGMNLDGSTTFDSSNTNLGALIIEGPAVVPLDFGPHGGEIMVADENNGQVHAIAKGTDDVSGGKVTYDVFDWFGAEGVVVIPTAQCSFCTGGSLFQAAENSNTLYSYPMTDFTSLGGSILVTSEFGAGTALMTFDGTNYNPGFFDYIQDSLMEGSAWADCDVPPPTPTPTPTPTATPTPTPTPTPTATPEVSPTPCTLFACTASYPFVSNNPLTNVAFNESTVMRGFRISTSTDGCTPKSIQVFYNDEHALTLGVRQVSTKVGKNTTATTYEVSDLSSGTNPTATPTAIPGTKPPKNPPANPGSVTNPDVGASVAQGGTDTAGRPMFPALFITDLSVSPGSSNALAGDWQYGGTAVPPTAVFGTWKAAVKTIDQTKNPATVTVTPDADPAKNNWNLGLGSDPVPAGLTNEGYGAEVRWDVPALGLISGHQYRLYFMVHDGDQNKTGGDVGQACGIFTMP